MPRETLEDVRAARDRALARAAAAEAEIVRLKAIMSIARVTLESAG